MGSLREIQAANVGRCSDGRPVILVVFRHQKEASKRTFGVAVLRACGFTSSGLTEQWHFAIRGSACFATGRTRRVATGHGDSHQHLIAPVHHLGQAGTIGHAG